MNLRRSKLSAMGGVSALFLVHAGGAFAADKPCVGAAAVATVAAACAQAGNSCNATTATIGSCTTLLENRVFDFVGLDLIVNPGGTMQINPVAVTAAGEVAPWLTVKAKSVLVRNGGIIRGTGTNSNGALDNATVIRVVAVGGDFVIEQGGLVISADRKLPGAHIIIQTIAAAPGAKLGNLVVAGEIRANNQNGDVGGDPVYGGKIFLNVDDPIAMQGGKITVTATGRVRAGSTDPGGPAIFMCACDGIDIQGKVQAQSKSGKNPSLEPFFVFGSADPLIFKINDLAAGIDEPMTISLCRFGGPFNPTQPDPANPALPLDNLGAQMSQMAAAAGSMVYGFSHEQVNISGDAMVNADVQLTENAPPFQVGLVAFKSRSDISVLNNAMISAAGGPPNAGFIDLLSLEGKITVANQAILETAPISFVSGNSKPNNVGGKINLKAKGDITYKDVAQLLSTGVSSTGRGGVINLESCMGNVLGSGGAVIDATGQAGNGTVTFKAPAPGPTGGGNVAPPPTNVQASCVAPDTVKRCTGGSCACLTGLQKTAAARVKVTGVMLDIVSQYFFKASCDPAGCPGAGCTQGTVDNTQPNTATEVTLVIPAGTPVGSHVIAKSDTGTFCTTATFNP